MAQLLDDLASVFVPIEKFEKTDDGSLLVIGKVTNDEIDLDDQIVDKDFARTALNDWFTAAANVREMHQPSAVGKGMELDEQDDGFHLKSKVVDPLAVKKVEEGIYTGYSVGISRPRIIRDNKAAGGRIVDGRIVEVSLVDRPALPTAKFLVAKMAGGAVEYVGAEVEVEKAVHDHEHTHIGTDGEQMTHSHPHRHASNAAPHGRNHMHGHPDGEPDDGEADMMKADDDGKCPTCKGTGKIMEGHRKCPDCGGSGKLSDYNARADKYAIVKRDMDPNVGGGVDRDKIPAEDFAGPHRTFPIVKPGDVSDAASSLGRADAADRASIKRRIIAIARRKGKEFVAELPDSWTQDADKAIRAAHDALCAVYSTDALKAAYPDGFGITADTLSAFFSTLDPDDPKASEKAATAAAVAAWQPMDDPTFLAARDAVHKSFADVVKGDIPKPGDAPNPAQFRRPYITAGTQREDGEGAPAPRMPKATHTPEPEDFNRGYLGADEQRQSPGDKLAQRLGVASGAEYIKAFNENREAAAVAWLHDSIARSFPDLCFMDTSDTATLDVRADAVPEPLHPESKAVEPDTTVAMGDVEKLITERIQAQEKAYRESIAELERRIHELEAAPDPARAPIRGGTSLDGRVEKRAQAEEDAQASEAKQRIDKWLKLAENEGNPVVRDEIMAVVKSLTAELVK